MKRLVVVSLVALAGCLGGQPAKTEHDSTALGNRQSAVPLATLRESNWKEAATGHGAAGNIPPETLVKMEAESAPGGDLH